MTSTSPAQSSFAPRAGEVRAVLGSAEALQLARAACRDGDLDQAEQMCRLLLARGDELEALDMLGTITAQSGRVQEALTLFQRAVALNPHSPQLQNNLGHVLHALGRHEEALAAYERALCAEPRLAHIHNSRGNVLYDLKRFEPALAAYDDALRLEPDNAGIHGNRGRTLYSLERFAQAEAGFERSLQLDSGNADAWNGRGAALHALARFQESLDALDHALRLNPDSVEILFNRGNALRDLHRFEEALAGYARTVEIAPEYAIGWANHSLALHGLQRIEEAAASYERALQLRPDDVRIRSNHAFFQLLTGDFARGWPSYEVRFAAFKTPRRDHLAPAWLGEEPLEGKTILLYLEQGFGDIMQFCRYVPLVARLGARVILEVPAPLAPLLRSLEGVAQLVTDGEDLPPADYSCPLMSLPLAFKTGLDSIPASIPYLRSDPAKREAWRRKLGPSTRLRVGLAWNGSLRARQPDKWAINQRRNIELAKLACLRDVPVEFHSLQKGEAAESDYARLKAAGWDGPELIDHAAELRDFSDTAALLDNLDLVVAVDTAVVHLAGALGKPVWMLNRFDTCWRWMLGREDTPWYPGMKLYRQQAFNDWSHPLERVRADLIALAAARRPAGAHPPPLSRAPAGQALPSPAQALQLAGAAYRGGDLARAEQLCRLMLAQGDDLEMLHLLGSITAQTGRHEEALALLQRALKLSPRSPQLQNRLGNILHALGRREEALAAHERALRAEPRFAQAHNDRGNVLRDLKHFAPALAAYDSALRFDPDNARVHNSRGLALVGLGHLEQAGAAFGRSLQLDAGNADAWNNHAYVLQELSRHEEACRCCEIALKLKPDLVAALTNLGNSLRALGRFSESLEVFDRALRAKPNHPAAWNDRGSALRDVHRFEEALACYARALELDPADVGPWSNHGVALQSLNRIEEARASYEHALRLSPDDAQARYNRSLLQLLTGDFARGWEGYELRWIVDKTARRDHAAPLWLGEESLEGKTIVLRHEQGLGDTLQFCRYVPLVARRGARVILEVPAPLAALLRNLEGVAQLVALGEPLPPADFFCTLMSLPLALGTEAGAIPARPYLQADPAKREQWRHKLGAADKLRVGLVWNGGFRPGHPDVWAVNQRRNIDLAKLVSLKDAPVEFHSLQKGEPAESELARLRDAGWDGPAIIDHAPDLDDFSDTAALIDNLDLVVAVDTSTAHLAGALGKPVWVLNRFDTCWRWMLGREDTPWYPGMKLYRQQAFNDWSDPVERVRADLIALAATR